MPPDTYFIIKLWINNETRTLGPYCDLQYATLVLVDHVPMIAANISETNAFNYKAEIHECYMQDRMLWNTVSIPITENKCRRRKPKKK